VSLAGEEGMAEGAPLERGPALASRQPHPVLTKYYQHERDRQPFVMALFEGAARHYDLACALMSLGLGQFYRCLALDHAGLARGMTVLDVATGTGLVARSAERILGAPRSVIGLDPSRAMLEEARRKAASPLVQGVIEHLPFDDGRFDFVSMGYALRHVADLGVAFRECLRVLRPGGRLLVLEITRPGSAAGRWILRTYLQSVLPLIMRLGTRSAHAQLLTTYYWDTIAECVPAETILAVLRESGFVGVGVRVRGGLLSEYVASKPAS
jgi:demethylmenaquinone methyltransferase/2-methoxy-6-polyprenyl-1,4-benzoquinol methylase